MEELSYIDEVDKFIQSKAAWQDFNQIDKKRMPVSKGEMDMCTIMVAALLTFQSWQRPVLWWMPPWQRLKREQTYIRTRDSDNCKGGWSQNGSVWKHHTCYSARQSVETRSLCSEASQDPSGNCPFLLCLEGGKQLTKLTSRFKTLAKSYGLTPITATKSERKRLRRLLIPSQDQRQQWWHGSSAIVCKLMTGTTKR